jgi:hypothetical protein
MNQARYLLAASVLHACSPDAAEPPKDAGRTDSGAPRPQAIDDPASPPRPPCSRTTVIVIETNDGARTWSLPLPCRPYDRLRDDPRPPE